MKKFLLLLLIISMLFSTAFASSYYYDGAWSEHTEDVKLYVDGVKIYCDVPPLIVDGRTLVPARAFFEKLGARVMWDENTRRVGISSADYSASLEIDSCMAQINGKAVTLDVPAKIITDKNGAGRTMIPVRFVAEHFGFQVDWDADTYSVMITDEQPLPQITSIKQKNGYESDVVEIKIEGKTNPKVMTLSNPSRLVLDFYGYEFGFVKQTFKGGETYSALRYAQHEDYTRIVFDMTCLYSYSVKNTDGVCTLTLTKTGDIEKKDEEKKSDTDKPKPQKTMPVQGKVAVVIDPGHGGSDPGAIGYKDDEIYVTEADANLDISLRLYEILKDNGVNVAITRTEDEWVDLYDRAPYANGLDASFFISVHNNSAVAKTAHGSSVYYYTGATDEATEEKYGITSKEAAQIILDEMIDACGLYDRKIQDGSKLVVLKHTQMPGVLVECAFISNDEEMELLNSPDFTQKMAQGIADGVIKVLKKMGLR